MSTTLQEEKEINGKAVIFTFGITALILLLLMLLSLHRPDPMPVEKIIEVPFEGAGDPDAGGGGGGSSAVQPVVEQEKDDPSSAAAENTEESPEVNLKPNTKPNQTTNVSVTKPNTNTTKPINNSALFDNVGDGDGKGDGKGSGKGDGEGTGTGGGKGDGNGPGIGSGHKPGIPGVGGDYILEGRKILVKPQIPETFTEEGKVVVNIWVDQNGNVTRTSINESKTNTSSSYLRSLAEKAAKKIKWDINSNAPLDQKGIYIFNFVLK